jgi:hypothetical protein
MKRSKSIEKLIKKVRYKASAQAYDKVIYNFLQALEDYKKQKSALTQPNIWRKIMETKVTRKVAVLCCLAMVSVAAATVGPAVYDTVQSFLSGLVGKSVGELVELADPMSAVPRQMLDLHELETGSGLELVSLHADNEWALAVTTPVVHVDEDGEREEGPLVITLIKRDDLWWVTDIDLETEATVEDELDRFFNNHPNAVEIPLR